MITSPPAASFTTEFGHTIPFVPGYYERNSLYAESIGGDVIQRPGMSVETAAPKLSMLAKDLVLFSGMIYFMQRWGLLGPWKNGIDLGGAEGTCAALFRAAGLIEHATNLDLADYSQVTSGPLFDEFLAFMRDIDTSERKGSVTAREVLLKTKSTFDFFPNQKPSFGLFQNFTAPAVVDEYRQQDIFDLTGTFDLILTFAVFDLLDIDKALAKVREVIAPNGLFVCMDEYWWYPINSSAIVGHFPYAMQRLSYKDLERYVGEHHPDRLPGLKDRYAFLYGGTQPPTINDWFRLAEKNKLRPVAIERIMSKNSHRLKDSPPSIFRNDWFSPDDVLRDIRCMKPDVVAEDLFTSHIHIAMVPA